MSIREEGPTVPTGSIGPARAAAPAARPQVARQALSSARLTGPAVLATERTAREASRRRCLTVLLVVLAAVPLVLSLAVSVGAVWIPPGQVWGTVLHHLTRLGEGAPPIADQIVWQVRVPRVLLAFVVGAGLAVAGAVLQAVVRNPLAEPYVLGVSAGASLAAVLVLTTFGAAGAWLTYGVPLAAFGGAVATLAAVVALGRRQGRLDPVRLLLGGVALSYLLQAGVSYVQLTSAPNQLSAVLFWLLGTVSRASWGDLGLPSAVVLACTGWLVVQGRGLNALLAGDEVSASLGIDVDRLRLQLLAVTAALTAVVIAVAGGVGFVGLVAPHSVRWLVGPEHRRLLPLAALLGGVFLVLADLVGRVLAQPLELPLNIVTAVAGVPFFLYLVRRSGSA